MQLKQITDYLDGFLEIQSFQDDSANGLQVENNENVEKIGLAVDACHETIVKAAEAQCNLLIVHHGLFWGRQQLLTDWFFQRVRALIMADIALYAVHLPLDAHPEVGHNAQIARMIGLSDIEPFIPFHGRPIGMRGILGSPLSCSEAGDKLEKIIGNRSAFLAFGPETVHSIGVVAGSATDPALFKELKVQGIDLFVTGEPKHGAYHLAQEFGLNIFYGGHYTTETFGMKELGRHLEQQLQIPALFIDSPCVL